MRRRGVVGSWRGRQIQSVRGVVAGFEDAEQRVPVLELGIASRDHDRASTVARSGSGARWAGGRGYRMDAARVVPAEVTVRRGRPMEQRGVGARRRERAGGAPPA